MASIVLGAVAGSVGAAAGGALFGSAGAVAGHMLGRVAGRAAGSLIDQSLFARNRTVHREGPRLGELAVQASTYGLMIPRVFGSMRLAGNVIWSRPITETAVTSTSQSGGGKGGGGGKVTSTSTTYQYSATLAVGVCEGPVDEVVRIWADSKLLPMDMVNARIYLGGEGQTPDPVIEAYEGVGHTPAYRGLCYVVFQDFPLEAFGNRIPNFTFEVRKRHKSADWNGQSAEEMVTAITLIPGAGEFVYDTRIQTKITGEDAGGEFGQAGYAERINRHTVHNKANVLVALDQMRATLPNVTWVSVVVTWFGTSLDAGSCTVMPGVEYSAGGTTEPQVWSVAGYDRSTAHAIVHVDGSPRYGGTPDDDSVLRLLTELRSRGYKILFYPMMFMDVDGKPWRGHMTGSPADVAAFFTKSGGFNGFVTHYAGLVAGKVDGFVIGSEMKGLTAVTDAPGNYPAVNALVSLAATVKGVLGSGVKVTYAADWSEYHHAEGGWYNLDPLWASPHIDVVGIDAYFPLADGPQNGYAVADAIAGWTQGEGYHWYYSDPQRTVQAPLAAPYAWKNVAWWWGNSHVNPNGTTTAWVPGSKKIWFAEFGFPSLDGALNQPNVFYDPESSDGGLPYYSKGRVDFRAQRQGVVGTLAKWAGSSMVERLFLWTWDARPFPAWPDRKDVWGDGDNWIYGHWVNGKFGLSSLAAIVQAICKEAGLTEQQIDTTRLNQRVMGYMLGSRSSARAALEPLMEAYAFDAVERDGVLTFIPRGNGPVRTIAAAALVDTGNDPVFTVERQQEMELPRQTSIVYYDPQTLYQPGHQMAQRMATASKEALSLSLPIAMSAQDAKNLAEILLYRSWVGRTRYRFSLPVRHAELEPADVIAIARDGVTHTMRVVEARLASPLVLLVSAVAEDVSAYDFYAPPGQGPAADDGLALANPTRLEVLDLPTLPGDGAGEAYLRFAACGTFDGWKGAVVYASADGGANYQRMASVPVAAAIGKTLDALPPPAAGNRFAHGEAVTVLLRSGELASATAAVVLNGGNAALLGDEVIQFTTAELLAPGKYRLSGLLRGRLGTEWAAGGHAAGERFVLLDGRMEDQPMPLGALGVSRLIKAVTVGESLGEAEAVTVTWEGRCLKPLAPVHITGSRDGSGNLSIRWIRRTRVGGEWRDYADAPLSEESERYDVEVMNGAAVVRTFSGLSVPSADYSAAQQTADFGSAQSAVSVRVYQLSAIAGRGYAGQGAV